MLFCIFCTYGPDGAERRQAVLEEHIRYVDARADKVFAAGGTGSDTETRNGALFIVEAEDMAAAEAFSAGDPLTKAGVFGDIIIRPFFKGLPKD